jgi:hypothetical protein
MQVSVGAEFYYDHQIALDEIFCAGS